jgi:glycosyltransferase involved in cell wall biosynthesis/SAM-dependent methyltransferase
MMMSNKPLVSGIIIFLNEEKFIQEAIESVFAQTYDNWELLLVDDGSTDGSSAIARCYADQYPEKVYYLEHEGHQNRGMSASRNLGVRHAKGNYIAFLDGDDVWLPNKLEQQVAILESKPEAAMLYGRTQFWYSWTGDAESLKKRDYLTELGIEPNTLVQPPHLLQLFLQDERTIACTCSVLIRREVFEKVGEFEESFRDLYSDMVFYTKLYLQEPVFVADGCWDRYRHHSENSWIIPIKTGKIHSARQNFLKWIERYLLEHDAKDTEAWQVLQSQLWACHHPILSRLLELVRDPIKFMNWLEGQIAARLPVPLLLWLRSQRHTYTRWPPVGWVNLGSLGRLTPISSVYGFDRGQPIDRYYIENFLASHANDIQGRVLEIGDPYYTMKFGGERVIRRDVLHAAEGNPYATIVGDLANADSIPSDTFDCLILTQTLQYVYDLPSALKTIYRILKPGGVALVTVPSITQLCDPNWWKDCWYWGFTTVSAQQLFEGVFPKDNAQVEAYGNVLAATAFLQGLASEELKKQALDYRDSSYQVLITVRAVKPEITL